MADLVRVALDDVEGADLACPGVWCRHVMGLLVGRGTPRVCRSEDSDGSDERRELIEDRASARTFSSHVGTPKEESALMVHNLSVLRRSTSTACQT